MVKLEKLHLKDTDDIIFETHKGFEPVDLKDGINQVTFDMSKYTYRQCVPILDSNGIQLLDQEGNEQWEYIPYEKEVSGNFTANCTVSQRVVVEISSNSIPPVIGYDIMAARSNMMEGVQYDKNPYFKIKSYSPGQGSTGPSNQFAAARELLRKQNNRNKSKLAKASRRNNRK